MVRCLALALKSTLERAVRRLDAAAIWLEMTGNANRIGSCLDQLTRETQGG